MKNREGKEFRSPHIDAPLSSRTSSQFHEIFFCTLSKRTPADHLAATLGWSLASCLRRKCRPPFEIGSQAPCHGHVPAHKPVIRSVPPPEFFHRLAAPIHLLCTRILRRPSELSTQPGLGAPGHLAVFRFHRDCLN